MAVLVNKNTKIMVQGITGTQASFHIQRAMKYGTRIVAGVVPNKNESSYLGVPLFGTVQEAKDKTGACKDGKMFPAVSGQQSKKRTRGRRVGDPQGFASA